MFSALIELAIQNLLYFALHLENNGAFPKPLSRDEEKDCLLKIALGDHAARNKLIEHNMRLVAYIVKKKYSDSKEQEDLISIGMIGLIKASETFDIKKDINFSTYAGTCIDNQIKMYFRKIKHLASEVHLNEPIDSDGEGNRITIEDAFRDPISVEDETELLIDRKKLYRFINEELSERERQIICRRYALRCGSEVPIKPMTQKEVAKSLKISRSYVSRIEKKALAKLREMFEKGKFNSTGATLRNTVVQIGSQT